MITTSKFQKLHNTEVERSYLVSLLEEAKKEENTAIVYRLSKLLNENPKDQAFTLTIKQYETTLAAPLKTASYKEALTENGGLKKGWQFSNGSVVKSTDPLIIGNPETGMASPKNHNSFPLDILAGLDYIEADDRGLNTTLNASVTPDQIYQMITDKMIKAVNEASGKEAKKVWDNKHTTGGFLTATNYVTKKPYRGVNSVLLKDGNIFNVFKNPYFLTFKQVKELKGKVKKNARGLEAVYFTRLFQYLDKDKKPVFSTYTKQKMIDFLNSKGYNAKQFDLLVTVIPILKYYKVFNGSDIEGIDFGLNKLTVVEKVKLGRIEPNPNNEEKIPIAEAILKNLPSNTAKIQINTKGSAFYRPDVDGVFIPEFKAFDTAEDYYRVLFHELIHSTGHPKRLDRNLNGKFGSASYAKEELIAEFGAVFLSAQAGILWKTNKSHSEYIKNWLIAISFMQKDNKLLMRCASAAQKAADYLLQLNEEGEPKFYQELIKKQKNTDKKNEVLFSKDDITYEVAYRAHTGTSFSPEKRAKAHQNDYYNFLDEVYKINYKKAKTLKKTDEFKTKFIRFKNGYLKRYLAYLSSKNGMMSTMITGASNFPVSRMRKKSETINKRLNELVEFGDKYYHFFIEKKDIIKTGSHNALEKLMKKLSSLEEQHNLMKKGNAVITKVLRIKGIDREEQIKQIAIGFEDFFKEKLIETWVKSARKGNNSLKSEKFYTTNLTAKIRNVKKQIELEKRLSKASEELGNTEIIFDGGTIIINREINKIQILFENKPTSEVRSFLKKGGNAFKWSPKNGVWQRQLNTYYKRNRDELFEFLKIEKKVKPKAEEKVNDQLTLALNGVTNIPEVITQNEKTQKIEIPSVEVEKIEVVQPTIIEPIQVPEQTPVKQIIPVKNSGRNSLAKRKLQMQGRKFEMYDVLDKHMSEFLGDIERKNKESLVLTIAGEQGSGKTRFAFRFMNVLAQKYKVGHASMEEHPESKVYWDKIDEYMNETALNNIDNPEIKTISQLEKLIEENDVIVIDSFPKLRELEKKFGVDKDLRKKYNGKLFLIVFQLTSGGKMRGGTESQFDGDCIFFVEKKANYKDSFVYANKNRYQNRPLDEIEFNIFSGQLNQKTDQENNIPESEPNQQEIQFIDIVV